MKWVFWLSLAGVAYAYLGYALLLRLLAVFRSRPLHPATADEEPLPTVSIIMAARNEAANLPAKLENLRRLQYPAGRLEVVVASDGSTDRTADILSEHPGWVAPVILPAGGGKALALNAAVARARGDILVFLDTRQVVDLDAVWHLVLALTDPSVGAVSGELHLTDAAGRASATVGIYWTIEKKVRKLESATGSVVGVTGAIYAMRRELWTDLPAGTILDDVLVPMRVARRGLRIVLEPRAIARDQIFVQRGREFARKVRTLTGNYQLVQLAPWLLSGRNPLLFRFVSHKMARLAVPALLVLMWLSSLLANGPLYRLLFWAQVALYALALLGELAPRAGRFKPVSVAHTFAMLNVAAAVAFYNFLAGRDKVWV